MRLLRVRANVKHSQWSSGGAQDAEGLSSLLCRLHPNLVWIDNPTSAPLAWETQALQRSGFATSLVRLSGRDFGDQLWWTRHAVVGHRDIAGPNMSGLLMGFGLAECKEFPTLWLEDEKKVPLGLWATGVPSIGNIPPLREGGPMPAGKLQKRTVWDPRKPLPALHSRSRATDHLLLLDNAKKRARPLLPGEAYRLLGGRRKEATGDDEYDAEMALRSMPWLLARPMVATIAHIHFLHDSTGAENKRKAGVCPLNYKARVIEEIQGFLYRREQLPTTQLDPELGEQSFRVGAPRKKVGSVNQASPPRTRWPAISSSLSVQEQIAICDAFQKDHFEEAAARSDQLGRALVRILRYELAGNGLDADEQGYVWVHDLVEALQQEGDPWETLTPGEVMREADANSRLFARGPFLAARSRQRADLSSVTVFRAAARAAGVLKTTEGHEQRYSPPRQGAHQYTPTQVIPLANGTPLALPLQLRQKVAETMLSLFKGSQSASSSDDPCRMRRRIELDDVGLVHCQTLLLRLGRKVHMMNPADNVKWWRADLEIGIDIAARQAAVDDGIVFCFTSNGVWLADHIPPELLRGVRDRRDPLPEGNYGLVRPGELRRSPDINKITSSPELAEGQAEPEVPPDKEARSAKNRKSSTSQPSAGPQVPQGGQLLNHCCRNMGISQDEKDAETLGFAGDSHEPCAAHPSTLGRFVLPISKDDCLSEHGDWTHHHDASGHP
jgi:RNA:NAD 2'-phosphotransferase (TPT1/KptA family)